MNYNLYLLSILSLLIFTYEINLPLQRVFRTPPETNSESFNPMTFQITVGTPPQIFSVGYDTGSYTTWLPDEEIRYQYTFDTTNSSSYTEQRFKLFSCETETSIEGNEFTDLVNIPNTSEKQYYFNMILATDYKNKIISADGNAGFARKYSNDPTREIFWSETKRFSFLEFLFNINKIEKKIFYHKYINDTHGELIIGEELEIGLKENTVYCKCLDDDKLPALVKDFWNCKVDKIKVENLEEIKEEIVVFSTGEKYIICPEDKCLKILEKYNGIYSNSCKMNNNTKGEIIMECEDIDLSKSPDIKIIFGKQEIKIDGRDLFFKENKKFYFVFKTSTGIDWFIFGDPFIRRQNMVFDFEKNSVGFLNKKLIQKTTIMYYLLWGILGFSVIAVIFFGVSSFLRYRKRVKLEKDIKDMERSYFVNEMGIQTPEPTSNYNPLL